LLSNTGYGSALLTQQRKTTMKKQEEVKTPFQETVGVIREYLEKEIIPEIVGCLNSGNDLEFQASIKGRTIKNIGTFKKVVVYAGKKNSKKTLITVSLEDIKYTGSGSTLVPDSLLFSYVAKKSSKGWFFMNWFKGTKNSKKK